MVTEELGGVALDAMYTYERTWDRDKSIVEPSKVPTELLYPAQKHLEPNYGYSITR